MVRLVIAAIIVLTTSSCIPSWLVNGIAAGNPGCLYNVPRSDNTVALTLDDGPDSATTPELLNILASNNGLHDGGYKGRNTAKTLSRLLPDLSRLGYRVVTLSELTTPTAETIQ